MGQWCVCVEWTLAQPGGPCSCTDKREPQAGDSSRRTRLDLSEDRQGDPAAAREGRGQERWSPSDRARSRGTCRPRNDLELYFRSSLCWKDRSEGVGGWVGCWECHWEEVCLAGGSGGRSGDRKREGGWAGFGHILKEMLIGLACGLGTRWGQVAIREGLQRSPVFNITTPSGAIRWFRADSWAGEVGSRLGVELRVTSRADHDWDVRTHPGVNVKEPVNVWVTARSGRALDTPS